MSHTDLIHRIENYHTSFKEEVEFQKRFLHLLRAHPLCFMRDLLFGHLTASAWITNLECTEALLLFHSKLQRWLQPGGHCDGETNVEEVAKKEVLEETGIQILHKNFEIFDLDIHSIPQKGNVPKHFHYDIRFHFKISKSTPILKNHESMALKWVSYDQIKLEMVDRSILRMMEKSLLK